MKLAQQDFIKDKSPCQTSCTRNITARN